MLESNVMQEKAASLIRRFGAMEAERKVFDSHFMEIAERVLPRADNFISQRVKGDKHTERQFDSTAALALDRFSAAMESMLTPRTQKWHHLRTGDQDLDNNPLVKRWLDEVTEILFQVRYNPKANFASQASEVYLSLGAFGTGAMFIDEALGQGIRYKAIPLPEIYIQENYQGVIDTVFRKYVLSARAAFQKWGDQCSEQVIEDAKESPEAEYTFLHIVMPNEDIQYGRKDYKGMAFSSCDLDLSAGLIVSEGGYRTFPYAVGRYVTSQREVYGRSPAMTVLPDIKMLNEMSKTVIRAAHKIVDPPLLLQEDGALTAFDMRPNALNYGGVNEQGQQVVHPLQTGGRVDIGMEMMDQRRKTINEAFLVTLFQILVDSPAMTATEAMLRAQEKGALLAPTMGRQQSEFLGPLIEREIDILFKAGVIPKPPKELAMVNNYIEVEYVGPLNRAQKAEQGVAILRTIEGVAPLAQIDPSIMEIFDAEGIARELADINGMPAKVLRTKEEMAQIKANKNQEMQAQQLLQAAPVLSGAAKDLAAAQAMSGQQQAPNLFPNQ